MACEHDINAREVAVVADGYCPLCMAADIERLTRDASFWKAERDAAVNHAVTYGPEIERLTRELKGIAEFCSGDDPTLGAIARLAHIRNTAERATAHRNQGEV